MDELTPRRIVEELDRYIIGQGKAKRAVAIALRNRHRRRMLAPEVRDEVIPKNILMIGPTGVGKTEVARRLANLARAPFLKVEATKFTEVGYVGRDVDSMVRDLLQLSIRMTESERMEEVQATAAERAVERIAELLQPSTRRKPRASDGPDTADAFRRAFGELFGRTPGASPVPEPPPEPEDEADDRAAERTERIRARLRDQIRSGARDAEMVEIEVEDRPTSFVQLFSPQGLEEMGIDLQGSMPHMRGRGTRTRKVTIAEAREVLTQEEARSMVDHDAVVRDAIDRAEQSGIIFVDELDKIAGKTGGHGPDVSREGVQRDILPIIEGSTVMTKHGPVRTNHVLFIAAGAFHVSKPSDLIPELQGRLPIRVELDTLTEGDFRRILTEPRNALVKQYVDLLATDGVELEFTEDAVDEIAAVAARVNQQSEDIGARRLHTVLERLLEEVSYDAPDAASGHIRVDREYVRARLDSISRDPDLSRYIL